MDSNNISTSLVPLDHIVHAYFGIVICFSLIVTGFWVVYFFHELLCIRRRYKRAMEDVRTFETEAVICDQKFKFVKNLILMLICVFESVAPISAFIGGLSNLLEFASFAYLICLFSIFLVFSLLNILTNYLIRMYKCTPDSKQDKLSIVSFLSKLALCISLSTIHYLLFVASLLIYTLFLREFILFVINGRLLDRVIGWKQQDLALENGTEGRVLAIKRMRRQYRLMKSIFIACSSCLILGLLLKPIRLYLQYNLRMPVGFDREILIYYFQISPIIIKWVIPILSWSESISNIPITVLALVYLIYTIYYFSSATCSRANLRVNIPCFNRNPRQPSIKRPFLS